ncbi:MAG: hypothetical protein WBW04_22975 [Nitrolancea sp.]
MLQRIAFGLAAGALATVVMDWSQGRVIPAASTWIERKLRQPSPSRTSEGPSGDSEGSPARVARWLAERIGVDLTHERAMELGNRIHWAYGTQWGLPFELMPVSHGPITGAAYGGALWLASDELLLWALGVSGKPSDYPLSVHLQALAAHAVYGTALGAIVWGLETAFHRGRSASVGA